MNPRNSLAKAVLLLELLALAAPNTAEAKGCERELMPEAVELAKIALQTGKKERSDLGFYGGRPIATYDKYSVSGKIRLDGKEYFLTLEFHDRGTKTPLEDVERAFIQGNTMHVSNGEFDSGDLLVLRLEEVMNENNTFYWFEDDGLSGFFVEHRRVEDPCYNTGKAEIRLEGRTNTHHNMDLPFHVAYGTSCLSRDEGCYQKAANAADKEYRKILAATKKQLPKPVRKGKRGKSSR